MLTTLSFSHGHVAPAWASPFPSVHPMTSVPPCTPGYLSNNLELMEQHSQEFIKVFTPSLPQPCPCSRVSQNMGFTEGGRDLRRVSHSHMPPARTCTTHGWFDNQSPPLLLLMLSGCTNRAQPTGLLRPESLVHFPEPRDLTFPRACHYLASKSGSILFTQSLQELPLWGHALSKHGR